MDSESINNNNDIIKSLEYPNGFLEKKDKNED